MYLYGLNVLSRYEVCDHIRSPPGLTCESKTGLKDGLADPGGWRDSYLGYQTSVDIQFTCEEEETVKAFVARIVEKVRTNELHSDVGYHVIGWALNLWHCPAVLVTSTPL